MYNLCFLNFNFESCDSTLKLEMTGIHLPDCQNRFKLNFFCRLDGNRCHSSGTAGRTASVESLVLPRQVKQRARRTWARSYSATQSLAPDCQC